MSDSIVLRRGETDEVDDDVFVPGGTPLGRHFTDVHHRLRVVGVDVEDGRVDDASHVRAVRWRPAEARVRRERDLTHTTFLYRHFSK